MTQLNTSRSLVGCAAALAGILLSSGMNPVDASQACSGRFMVHTGAPQMKTITVDGRSVSISSDSGTCGPVMGRVRMTASGVRVRAQLACGSQPVLRLKASIDRACETMIGTLGRRRGGQFFEAGHTRCGDGLVDAAAGEQCDDGNGRSGDGCEPTCLPTPTKTPVTTSTTTTTQHPTTTTTLGPPEPTSDCLNGIVEPGEECDDGNPFPGDGCELDCTRTRP